MLDLRNWLIQRQPLWPRNALNLTTSEVPRGLYLDRDVNGENAPPIMSVIDAYQGGIAVAQDGGSSPSATFTLDNGANGLSAIIAGTDDPTIAGLLIACSGLPSVLAANRKLMFAVGNNATGFTLLNFMTMVSATNFSWTDVAGKADARIYIPPGCQIKATFFDQAGVESVALQTRQIILPAGFKPF